jgi:cyclase
MKELTQVFSRRSFLAHTSRLGAAYAAAKLLPLPVWAQALPNDPRVSQTPVADKGYALVRKIGNGLYATISDRTKGLQTRSNGGILVGRDAALVIEGFQTPEGATFQLDALRMITKVPLRAAIDTHFHFDHTMGNSAYAATGAPIWAHAKAPKRMVERYVRMQGETKEAFLAPLEKRVREAKSETIRQHAQTDVEGMTGMYDPVVASALAFPNHLLDPEKLPLKVDLGGLTAVIESHLGHTDTDLIIRVPDQNVVYTGDVLVNAQYGTNIDGTPSVWRATLAKLAAFDKNTLFVPGHGQICGLEAVALLRAVFDDIAEQAEKMYKAGVPVEEAFDRYVVPAKYKDFRQFSWGFTIGRTIEQLYAEWSGKPGHPLSY